MNASRYFFPATLLLLLVVWGGAVAQPYRNGPPPAQSGGSPRPMPAQSDDLTTVLRQLRTGIADLRHELSNHDAEIRTFEEKLHNHESTMYQMREQVTRDLQTQRDYAKAGSVALEGKVDTLDKSMNNVDQSLKSLDGVVKGVMADLRQLKDQSNESVAVLAQYKQKIIELDKLIELQNQSLKNVETALHNVIDAFQTKETVREATLQADGSRTYKVQAGDRLEKIAKNHNVTIQALRDANPQLNGDRIIVGQTLKIP